MRHARCESREPQADFIVVARSEADVARAADSDRQPYTETPSRSPPYTRAAGACGTPTRRREKSSPAKKSEATVWADLLSTATRSRPRSTTASISWPVESRERPNVGLFERRIRVAGERRPDRPVSDKPCVKG